MSVVLDEVSLTSLVCSCLLYLISVVSTNACGCTSTGSDWVDEVSVIPVVVEDISGDGTGLGDCCWVITGSNWVEVSSVSGDVAGVEVSSVDPWGAVEVDLVGATVTCRYS